MMAKIYVCEIRQDYRGIDLGVASYWSSRPLSLSGIRVAPYCVISDPYIATIIRLERSNRD